ncbi:MAG: hypothetical protein M0Q53_14275 [Prolixibacteraceae bacterium]|jgi:hypothetical protein|nr:hypothetical protein [Prolixibacteraceae bacterium]
MKKLVTTSMAVAALLFLSFNAANAQIATGSSLKGTTHATVNATKAATAVTNAVNKITNATTNAVNKTTNATTNAVKASTNVAVKASKATVNSAQNAQTSVFSSDAVETKAGANEKGLKTDNSASAREDANVDVSRPETGEPNKPAEEAKSTKGMIEASTNASEQAHANSNEHSAVQKGDALLKSSTSTTMNGSATVSAKPATTEVKETTTETKTKAANKVADVKAKSASAKPSLKADASTSVQADSKIKVGNK